MAAEPALLPVINPLLEFTLATEVSELDQIPPETVDEKLTVFPLHMLSSPLSIPAIGDEITDIVLLERTSAHTPPDKV